jgi:hypothetical protein
MDKWYWLPTNSRTDEGPNLLTEQEVSRSWLKLFKGGDVTQVTFTKAEDLLDALRPESPLRHRLSSELTELRELHGVPETV